MSLRLKITTFKPDEIEKRFQQLEKELEKKGQGQISSVFLKETENEFYLIIAYPMANRVANWIVEKEFRNTLKKIDPDIKIEKIKEKEKY